MSYKVAGMYQPPKSILNFLIILLLDISLAAFGRKEIELAEVCDTPLSMIITSISQSL